MVAESAKNSVGVLALQGDFDKHLSALYAVGVNGKLVRTEAELLSVDGLIIPEPTKSDSAPSCIIRDASAGVAMPPAAKLGTGSLPSLAVCFTSS